MRSRIRIKEGAKPNDRIFHKSSFHKLGRKNTIVSKNGKRFFSDDMILIKDLYVFYRRDGGVLSFKSWMACIQDLVKLTVMDSLDGKPVDIGYPLKLMTRKVGFKKFRSTKNKFFYGFDFGSVTSLIHRRLYYVQAMPTTFVNEWIYSMFFCYDSVLDVKNIKTFPLKKGESKRRAYERHKIYQAKQHTSDHKP